jgi:thermostable 8-oxoguanine DNA glycosylase
MFDFTMKKIPRRNPLVPADIAVQVQEWKILGKPRQGGIDWNLASWAKEFPEHQEFFIELKKKNLGLLDRNTVHGVVSSCLTKGELEVAFLVVMIWGFGFRGYGRFRSNKIIEDKAFKSSLKKTIEALNKGDVIAAYEHLIENGPDGLGCAFGSKFLYFAASRKMENYPLIIDSLVGTAINNAGLARIAVQSLKADKYFELIKKFHEAADFYEIQPDELEELLFTNVYKIYTSSDWSVVQDSELSRNQKMAWAMLLATDIERKSHAATVSRTFPGGGQYDCVRIRLFKGLDMELNLNGGIFVHSEFAGRFDWSSAIKLGILKTSKRLRGTEGESERAGPSASSNSYAWLSRALIGDAEIDVDDFIELEHLSAESKSQLEQRFKHELNPKSIWVLYKAQQICGLLDFRRAIAIDLDGNQTIIKEDSHMPYEMYDGPDLDT